MDAGSQYWDEEDEGISIQVGFCAKRHGLLGFWGTLVQLR